MTFYPRIDIIIVRSSSKYFEKDVFFMSKLTASDKKFFAFLAAITAGCTAFVVSAVVGAKAFARYCEGADYDSENEA